MLSLVLVLFAVETALNTFLCWQMIQVVREMRPQQSLQAAPFFARGNAAIIDPVDPLDNVDLDEKI